MTHEWKAGDRAMVEIGEIVERGVLLKQNNIEPGWLVPQDLLKPLPTLNPHQELRDAVVEAAMKWESMELNAAFDLQTKVKVLRAAMQLSNYLEGRDIAMKKWHQAL